MRNILTGPDAHAVQTFRSALRQRLMASIALFAMLLSALAPAISQAMVPVFEANGLALVEICTSQGMQWVAVDAAEREQGQGDMADMASCPYCCPHAGTFALPPPDTAGPGLVHPDLLLPPLFYLAPRPLFAWAASHPRAPPLAA
ncbi:DUF2946 domain-containing protein [Parazoarcus communis]|uniref:DUF2946 domain-containing protein n=1 Tax=Parazoarcus communis TaxID=41977 RepID=UPI002006EB38|nr:DUF2946 domain-containing protein [Parazoarcus communis]